MTTIVHEFEDYTWNENALSMKNRQVIEME